MLSCVGHELAAAGHLHFVHGKDEVPDGARDEHIVRPGEGADPRADVDGHTADVVTDELALAGVQTGTHGERADLLPPRQTVPRSKNGSTSRADAVGCVASVCYPVRC